jgi:hypothetical protein
VANIQEQIEGLICKSQKEVQLMATKVQVANQTIGTQVKNIKEAEGELTNCWGCLDQLAVHSGLSALKLLAWFLLEEIQELLPLDCSNLHPHFLFLI